MSYRPLKRTVLKRTSKRAPGTWKVVCLFIGLFIAAFLLNSDYRRELISLVHHPSENGLYADEIEKYGSSLFHVGRAIWSFPAIK